MSLGRILGTKREVDFFDVLLAQAEKTLSGCQSLLRFLEEDADPEELDRLEKEADDIRRILIDELNQTFITPIDREDIFDLSRAIDDVIDHARNTVKEMEIFEVKSNEHPRCRLTWEPRKWYAQIQEDVPLIRQQGGNSGRRTRSGTSTGRIIRNEVSTGAGHVYVETKKRGLFGSGWS